MGKQKNTKDQIKHLNQIIVQKNELIKSQGQSMDTASPSGGWFNQSNGFGPQTDPTFETLWASPYEFMYQELTRLYQNPLIYRMISLYSDDPTKSGFELMSKDDNEQASEIKKEMDDRFNWISKCREMIAMRHLYRGGVLYADIDDGREPEEPLNEANVKKIWAFHPVESFLAVPYSTRPLLKDEKPGQPAHYNLTIMNFRDAKVFRAHESRLIRFPSYEADDVVGQKQRARRITWPVSTVQRVYDTVKRYGIGMQSESGLLQQFTMDVFKIKNLNQVKDLEGFKKYAQEQWQLRSSMKLNVVGSEDELERMATPTTGMAEITKDIRLDVGMTTGIPVPIFFSEESGALGGSTLGESQKVWNGTVTATQKNQHTPFYKSMLYFYGLEQGIDPEYIKNLEFKYNEIEYRTATEQAELENKNSETAKNYVEMGLPETSVFDAQLSTGTIKVGAYDYDPDEFAKGLEDKEEMEADQIATEQIIRENEAKNTDPDRQDEEKEKKDNLENSDKSLDDYNVVFEV